jgi:hypothetical protein
MSAAGTPEAPWPPESLALAQQLQRSLSIDDRQWHRLKRRRSRRAAEQLAAALVQSCSMICSIWAPAGSGF